MESRVVMFGIIVEETSVVKQINDLLHEQRDYIVAHVAVPYHERGINVISVVMDAPENIISSVSGKLGMLPGVSCKITYSKIPD